MTTANPLLDATVAPFGLPAFGAIDSAHFRPAFEAAMAENSAEIERIATDPRTPDFDNTIAALERSGRRLRDVGAVFWNLAATDSTPELQAVEREASGALARHETEILLNAALFARVDALFSRRESLALSPEQARVLELIHTRFLRAGARLDESARARMTAISERLANLTTTFAQNVLADEAAYVLLLEKSDLDGLSEDFRAAAAEVARERGAPGKYGVTLARSNLETFLQSSTRRDLREAAFRAFAGRGESGGDTDNRAVIAEILRLREERAKLLGFDNFAAYKLDDTMAKTPAAVRELLDRVWEPALAAAKAERDELQALAQRVGDNLDIAAWDWRFYAERLREEHYALDQTALRPYFSLDAMIAAAFHVAERLFGLRFVEVHGLELYHPSVRVFDVRDAGGAHVALFLGDYFARPSKRGGAWMSEFRGQERLDDDVRPIVVNVMNFAKAPEGETTLLSLDDARTLFHEFGHALHGMLSDVTYPSIAGTSVARDFVELPSQLYEHWLLEPQILREFARHAATGEPMPEDMLERIARSRHFNQGFASVEFCASAYVDLDLHERGAGRDFDAGVFERESLARISMPQEIVMRHRTPHFTHVFAGDGYSAGYYSYLWAETLDADAFEAFVETGDVFAPQVAAKLREHVYAAGGRQDPASAYLAFRGRMPSVEPLLRQRGFSASRDA
ncbi:MULTISPECIES: M3 family metallopeptidase [Methylosinus]|uniref:Peptidase M3 n=1 Tax=Methylosinus trichosporium (strain ATCC 35070 / NCIMB 11131 / UNIQEM 75 / OB3b) TaxID=595536 RepID=A0A2D2D590_METT3|nr:MULTISPECIES: M3 family metallopeptidase [Methylosinus]ATQ70133.1 peptidase M3 [Methylosinus trichosporium OB3b]